MDNHWDLWFEIEKKQYHLQQTHKNIFFGSVCGTIGAIQGFSSATNTVWAMPGFMSAIHSALKIEKLRKMN